MKVLYAIQGTGNGHVSRATEIIPILRRLCDCDTLISSSENEINPGFKVNYRVKGLGFIFGSNGGIDIPSTLMNTQLFRFRNEIRKIPVEDYDLVINDFEPVTAWACRVKNIPCIGLSHQVSLLSKKTPSPKHGNWLGQQIIRYYAPVSINFGFHFAAYDDFIFTPVIRSSIRRQSVQNAGHYTVYLPAWNDRFLINYFQQFNKVKWHLFSKHARKITKEGNILVFPVSGDVFTQSMAFSEGVLCGAGFETPSEVLYLHKKLMVIPMKGQYEQLCNSEALSRLGIPVIRNLNAENSVKISEWLSSEEIVKINYSDQTEIVICHLLDIAEKMVASHAVIPEFG